MTAIFCENAADRSAPTWERQLAPFDRLEFVISDAAGGISKAVSQLARARRDDPKAPALEHGLDVFHTTMEARRVLARHWRMAEAAWEKAEAAELELPARNDKGSTPGARPAPPTRPGAGRPHRSSRPSVSRRPGAGPMWRSTCSGPTASSTTAATARAEIAEAVKGLRGADWSKVRNFLNDPRSLSFLGRMHRRLELAEPRAEWREAMAWRWWPLHRRASCSGPSMRLVRAVGRDRKLDQEERASFDRVSAVFLDTFRASSAVECMNSVLRMQQSRHKVMTQPMLDLKRLHWNCHEFRGGPRKKACPYQALGLDLPTFDFWTLLQTDPGGLTQRLSTARNAK